MFKKEDIKKALWIKVDLESKYWVVFSWFAWDDLLFENGVIFWDKKIVDNFSTLYDQFVLTNKKINVLVIDIVFTPVEIKTPDEVQKIDLLNEWIFIWDVNNPDGSFVLPNMEWVKSLKDAMWKIKGKVQFSSKKINMYKFKTKRFTFYKD